MRHILIILSCIGWLAGNSSAFEGRINATLTRGTETLTILYTVAAHDLRVECTGTAWPHAKNLVNLDTGAMTLVFPHNRSFLRLKPAATDTQPTFPGARPPGGQPPGVGPGIAPGAAGAADSGMPELPPGIGPQPQSGTAAMPAMPHTPSIPDSIVPTHLSGAPQMPSVAGTNAGFPAGIPAMPMMRPPSEERVELTPTDEKKEILGFPCTRYELKQRGEVMEIWATDKLFAFQPWLANQPPRFGPRMIEDQWGELLKAKKLFPLLATLKFENGPERLRFEVKSVVPERIENKDGALFQPPPDYHQLEPNPF
ncbi:MAG: DUF4412 domain-containing protein [Verrucomicrobiota bacterium]